MCFNKVIRYNCIETSDKRPEQVVKLLRSLPYVSLKGGSLEHNNKKFSVYKTVTFQPNAFAVKFEVVSKKGRKWILREVHSDLGDLINYTSSDAKLNKLLKWLRNLEK